MLRKIAPVALLVIGPLVMLGAFLLYASNAIPYQDATPEMLSHQASEAKRWAIVFMLGSATAASGAMWSWRRWRAKKHRFDAR